MEEKNKFQARVGGYRLDEVNENFSNLDTCSALITWGLWDYFFLTVIFFLWDHGLDNFYNLDTCSL